MMLALGMFVFELRTLPYQSMQHSKDYRCRISTSRRNPTRYFLPGWLTETERLYRLKRENYCF